MIPDERCPKCNELWGIYAKATADHVRLTKKQGAAESVADSVGGLNHAIKAVETRRDSARAAVSIHISLAHPITRGAAG